MGTTLTPWLDHLLVAVQRYIHRHGHRMVQASGTLNQLYVSLIEARRLLGTEDATPTGAPSALGLPDMDALQVQIAQSRATLEGQTTGQVAELRDRFNLGAASQRLLMAAAAPLLSVDLARLYGFAWADFAVKLPTVGFLTELLADEPGEAAALQSAFAPDGPLVRYRLVELRESAAWGTPTPRLHRGVVVPEAVLAFLRGERTDLPSVLATAGRLSPPSEAIEAAQLFLAADTLASIRSAMAGALRKGRPRLFITGPAGVGRRTTVASVAAESGFGVLTVALHRLPKHDATFAERLAEAAREALLRRAVLLLRADDLLESHDDWALHAPAIGRLVNAHRGPVVFTAYAPAGGLHRAVRDLFDVTMRLPESTEQREVWRRALSEHGAPEDVCLAEPLSKRFSLSPGTVHEALVEARGHLKMVGGGAPLHVNDVAIAVRRRLEHTLSQVAEPFSTGLTWDDVVLPEEVMGPLEEIMSRAKYREQVYDDWGFRRKMSYGRGLACLFTGPPGTGKTMVTALIAQTLGRELYRVDLSRIVSKWVGETEKNLGRVFDEAERAQVILLFDEADSLFSTRTEVKGSNDRFANMEINYLLQRMESYDGMSLLTTNFEKSIDEAFKRRLKFKVNFPLPEAKERELLWQRMLPDRAEIAEGIRWNVLGKKYKMSGGNIKNAVLRAAFYAAREGGPINHERLERAAIAESRDMGRLV